MEQELLLFTHTGSNGRLLVELEYINKQKNNYIDIK
jgi:hypothetical protein